MERSDDAHFPGDKFSGLLCSRALPNPDSTRGASADTDRERHRGVNQNAAFRHRRLEMLEQSSLAFEWNREHQNVGGSAGGAVFHSPDLSFRPDSLLNG